MHACTQALRPTRMHRSPNAHRMNARTDGHVPLPRMKLGCVCAHHACAWGPAPPPIHTQPSTPIRTHPLLFFWKLQAGSGPLKRQVPAFLQQHGTKSCGCRRHQGPTPSRRRQIPVRGAKYRFKQLGRACLLLDRWSCAEAAL